MRWLSDLRTQSDFRGNWYGALTNQVSHTAMGAFWAALFACIWRVVTGEMPPRPGMILVVTGTYAAVELLWQRYENKDSLIDIFMVFAGSAMISLPFYQVQTDGAVTVLHFLHWNFLYVAIAWVLILIPYVIHRGLSKR